jgi:hypothetical protein
VRVLLSWPFNSPILKYLFTAAASPDRDSLPVIEDHLDAGRGRSNRVRPRLCRLTRVPWRLEASMLASLLPGLRELRTPLVVGWIWLVTIWVAFGRYLGSLTSIPLVRDVVELSGVLGQATILALIAFIAYLLGSLIVREGSWNVDYAPYVMLGSWRPLGRWLLMRQFGSRGFSPHYAAVGRELTPYLQERAQELDSRLRSVQYRGSVFSLLHIQPGRELLSPADLGELRSVPQAMDYVANYILGQRTQLETRLLAEKREVYDYYDRLKESAGLRGALSPVILALGVVIAIRLTLDRQPIWSSALALLVAVGISYALAVRGREQFHKSTEALATAVIV